jgi:YidC/Oxa1 family membrane protein insertase
MGSDQKRAFLAVILSAGVLFTWQLFFGKKDIPVGEKAPVNIEANGTSSKIASSKVNSTNPSPSVISNEAVKVERPALENQDLKSFELVNGESSLVIDNSLNITDFKSKFSVFSFEKITGSKKPFSLKVIRDGKTITPFFTFSEVNSYEVIGVDPKHDLRVRLVLNNDGELDYSLTSNSPFSYQVAMNSSEGQSVSRQTRDFTYLKKDVERFSVGDDDNIKDEGTFQWIALDFDYHILAVIFDKSTSGRFNVNLGSRVNDLSTGDMHFNNFESQLAFGGKLIFVKKEYDLLKSFGHNLHLSVDFGIFGLIAVPLLRGLQFIYKYIPNYGLAIIFLTLLVRLALFPLQIKSFKSMKKMQLIQPEMQKLKEKYKDNKQKQQEETMALFKKAGANPMGGCLPLVLQMPVFFAFYQVLYNTVELVNAPFFFWITDLSIKDPYYVLPVLMGIAMFGQTKLTPSTTADPTQQKVMLFMPLFMIFIMKDFPAGLNLYMFISTSFGAITQFFVHKSGTAPALKHQAV